MKRNATTRLLGALTLILVLLPACKVSFFDKAKNPSNEAQPVRYKNELPGPAPWSADPIPTSAVSEEHLRAWEESEVRDSCPLLLPASPPPGRPGAAADDATRGWIVWFGGEPPRVAISALGGQARSDFARPGSLKTYAWREGDLVSAVRYFPNYPDPSRGTDAIILIDGMECGYRVFDPLGADHLDQLITELRFVERDPRKDG